MEITIKPEKGYQAMTHYPQHPAILRSELRKQRITFLDYDHEGMLPLRLAQNLGEAPPLLLCHFEYDGDDAEIYRAWNNDMGEYIGPIWY
jgi:hypothetical protein